MSGRASVSPEEEAVTNLALAALGKGYRWTFLHDAPSRERRQVRVDGWVSDLQAASGATKVLPSPVSISMTHPDDLERVQEAIRRFLYEKAPYDVEHRIIRPDGSGRHAGDRLRHERQLRLVSGHPVPGHLDVHGFGGLDRRRWQRRLG